LLSDSENEELNMW